MKKIIVDGKSRNKSYTFKCPNKNCGCIFKADMDDIGIWTVLIKNLVQLPIL